jgi:ligand-binding sensor domain-containing protein
MKNIIIINLVLFLIFIIYGANSKGRFIDLSDSLEKPYLGVSSIFQDDKGVYWFYQLGGGITRYDGKKWEIFIEPDVLGIYTSTLPMDNDTFGNMWFGIPGGLLKYDGKDWQYFTSYTSIMLEDLGGVQHVLVDKDNTIWIATINRGLINFDYINNKIKSYDTTNSMLTSNSILDIKFDRYGNLWGVCGIWADDTNRKPSLFKFNGSEFKIFGKENSDFGLDRPKCLAIDSLDNIWIGGGPLNLQKFDGTEWKSFRDVLFPCNVSDLDFDKNNNLWVSSFSSGCGLFRFDGANWNNFNPDNSELTDGIIMCTLTDQNNKLWIGTFNGLFVYEGDAVSVEEPENIFEDIKIEQNIPNPFDGTTEIKCIIPEKYGKNIKLVITDGTGLNVLKKYKLEPVIENNIKVSAIEFETGAYVYGISINGEIVKSKKMMIIK